MLRKPAPTLHTFTPSLSRQWSRTLATMSMADTGHVHIPLLEDTHVGLVSASAHHYVFRLEVLMDDVLGVEVQQPVTHAHNDGAFVCGSQLWRQNGPSSERCVVFKLGPPLSLGPWSSREMFFCCTASRARQLHLKLKQHACLDFCHQLSTPIQVWLSHELEAHGRGLLLTVVQEVSSAFAQCRQRLDICKKQKAKTAKEKYTF